MMEKNRIILSFNLDAKSAPTRPSPPRVMSKPAAVPQSRRRRAVYER